MNITRRNLWKQGLETVDSWVQDSRKKPIFYLLYFIPFILYILFIGHYGVNVPYWDEVDTIIGLLKAYIHHSLSLDVLWQQHNEHRIFFPSLIEVLILSMTHANVKAEMYFSATLLLSIAILIFLYTQKYKRIKPLYLLPVPLILFSPIQWENSLWGFQVAFFLALATFVASMFFLQKALSGEIASLLPSVVFAFISSYSSLQGLLCWVIGGVFIFLLPFEKGLIRKRIWVIVLWSISGVTAFLVYFHGWQHPGYHPSVFFPFQHPIQSSLYFLGSVGNVSGANLTISCAIGFVLLLAYALILTQHLRNKNFLFPISLILFSLFFDLMITFGRSGFGPEQALSSRYTSFNLVGIAGLYVILANYFGEIGNNLKTRRFKGMFLIFFLVLISVSYVNGLKNSKTAFGYRKAAQQTALHYKTASPDSIKSLINPSIPAVSREFGFLERHKWNVFYSR